MNEKTTLNIRIDSDLKNKAEEVIDELGLNTSSAIVLFFKALIRYEGLPFDVKLAKEPKKIEKQPLKKASGKAPKAAPRKRQKITESDSIKRAIDKL